jgi:hypothetical protein
VSGSFPPDDGRVDRGVDGVNSGEHVDEQEKAAQQGLPGWADTRRDPDEDDAEGVDEDVPPVS